MMARAKFLSAEVVRDALIDAADVIRTLKITLERVQTGGTTAALEFLGEKPVMMRRVR